MSGVCGNSNSNEGSDEKDRFGTLAGFVATAALAQELPPGPPVSITMVTQLSPTIPQYTRTDIPMLREGIPKRSGGRISVTLASWPERNLNGPELLRVLRAGQIDLGGIALPTVAGDAPLLDIIDLAGCSPRTRWAARSPRP